MVARQIKRCSRATGYQYSNEPRCCNKDSIINYFLTMNNNCILLSMVSSLWGIEIGFDEKSATHCQLVSSTSTKSIGLPSGIAMKMLNVEEVRLKE